MPDFQRNGDASEIVRVEKREYKGKEFVDVRIWYLPQGSNDYAPTKKGVTMSEAVFAQLQAVQL